MKADTYPLQVLLWTFSGWVNRHQQDVIAYLVKENRVLKEQVKGRRLRLTDEQRRRLAAKGQRLGKRAPSEFRIGQVLQKWGGGCDDPCSFR